MQTKTGQALTAQSIVDAIVASDSPKHISANLRELMDFYFLHSDSPTQDEKENLFSTYSILDDAMVQITSLDNEGRVI